MSQLRRYFGLFALTACPVVACSVINSYDDVAPLKGEGGSANASGGTGGAHAGSAHGGAMTGVAGDDSTAGQAGDAGGEAGAGPTVPAKGLLAVAGTDPSRADANVLSLIDPETGHEVVRQTIAGAAVVGLAYDGASGRDAWFEFTGASFPADPASKAALTVFHFTDAGATWKVVSSHVVPGLPPPRPETFVVLNDRLAYLSYTVVAGKPTDSLTVLDTSDPKAVSLVKFNALDFGSSSEVLGMVGTRGVLGDASALGGTLAIAVGTACAGSQTTHVCGNVKLLPVTVGDDVSQGVPVDMMSQLIGQPAFTSAQAGQLGYVAFTTMLGKSVSLKHFDPRNLAQIDSGSPAFKAVWLGGLAYAECQSVALFTGVTQGRLFSASLAGLTADFDLGHAGQSLVYEPYTQHVITLYNPSNPSYDNSGLGEGGSGSASAEPALDSFDITKNAGLIRTAAVKWDPPADLAPNLAVARFPVDFACK